MVSDARNGAGVGVGGGVTASYRSPSEGASTSSLRLNSVQGDKCTFQSSHLLGIRKKSNYFSSGNTEI